MLWLKRFSGRNSRGLLLRCTSSGFLRLAAKVGIPRVGALIGLAHDPGKYSYAFHLDFRRSCGRDYMKRISFAPSPLQSAFTLQD